jgi:hypothetical protein
MRQPRRSFRTIAPVFVGLQALALISCEPSRVVDPLPGDDVAANAQRGGHRVNDIVISASDSSLSTGQQVQADAVVKDQKGNVINNAILTWDVASRDVATVSATGVITGGAVAGTTTVSVSADGITRTMAVSVAPAADTTSNAAPEDTTSSSPDTATTSPLGVAVHMISITANATTLKIGELTQVSGVARDVNGTAIAGVPITWSTSPTSVATIASTGATSALLTAKGIGTATVYAKADTAVRSITVTVIDSASTTTTTTVPQGASGGSYGTAIVAELPRATVSTAYPTAIRQIRVPAGANLQTAIDAAQPGDELLLAPGATYLGNFYLPDKGATSNWVTIRTDLFDATIGAPGTRMTPSRAAAANLAKILSPNIYSTLTTAISAHHYRFTGVEIGTTSTVTDINAIVRFGDNTTAQNSAANTANNLILDRTYIHGQPNGSTRRCIMLNSASTAVVDSWAAECHSNNGDSQAIVGWNGPGPYLIQNNYLEAGHEVIMFGGGGVTVLNVSPSDITIRGNHITRPASWKGVWQVKNLIETKHARRLLVEGNVIENTWLDSQVGYAFVMKSENQTWDTPWTQSTDITIRYNRIRNVGAGFNIAANPSGAPAVPAARFVITDNIMENVGNAPYLGDGRVFQLLGGLTDIVAMHNTFVSASGGNSASFYFGSLPTIQRLVVHSNVLHHGAYGIKGDSYGEGSPTLNIYAGGSLVTNNAIANGGGGATYPANNFFPATLGSLGFVDLAGGNYRLSASSPYLGKGYDGRDIGADINQIDALTRNAVVAPYASPTRPRTRTRADRARSARVLVRAPVPCYSPYGIQMFLTCVAWRRNSRPSPLRGSSHARRSESHHVRFMFPADASSTAFTPAGEPKYHTASTSSCSASVRARVSFTPVTTLITPAGTSDVSST